MNTKINMKRILPFVLAGTICGCAGPPKKTMQIDSDPEGMRIEMNNAYLGDTPTTYSLVTNPEGEFLGSWANAPEVIFTATPPYGQTNLYIQTKTFSPNGFFRAGDKIPERMFFDMHIKSEPSEHLNFDAK
jgi:hypothetical protein